MAITVVGSVAFDSIETPAGKRERCLGGAATYFSLSASFFTDVRVIAVVGEDFGKRQEAVFDARSINTAGIERTKGKCFAWEGSYMDDLNEAKTRSTELNVFASFEPKIPDSYRDSKFLFLANIDPVLQRRVRDEMPDVKLVGGDTMNYWIKDHRPALLEVLKGLDILLINDTEVRMLAGKDNLVQAARAVLALGPRALVVKHGEYGATLFHGTKSGERSFRAPAMLLEQVCGRLFRLLGLAAGTDAGRLPPRHVLRQRDGLVCVRVLRHRAAAEAHAQGNRRTFHRLSRVDAP
jgi:sugar/nucleoside kinase (ribokinase family)